MHPVMHLVKNAATLLTTHAIAHKQTESSSPAASAIASRTANNLFNALTIAAVLLTSGCAVTMDKVSKESATHARASQYSRLEIVSQCTQTINQYTHYRDQLNAQALADLFIVDGVFDFPGLLLRGREAIAGRLRNDDGSTTSRHLTGSIVVSVNDNNTITAQSYAYVLQADTPEQPGVVPATHTILAEYHDQLRMTPSGCKFVSREVRPVFMPSR